MQPETVIVNIQILSTIGNTKSFQPLDAIAWNLMLVDDTSNNNMSFNCSRCSKVFSRNTSLRKHVTQWLLLRWAVSP